MWSITPLQSTEQAVKWQLYTNGADNTPLVGRSSAGGSHASISSIALPSTAAVVLSVRGNGQLHADLPRLWPHTHTPHRVRLHW